MFIKEIFKYAFQQTIKNQFEVIRFRFLKKDEFKYSLNTNFKFFPLPSLNNPIFDSEKVLKQADLIVERKFDLLGSGEYQFDEIPWHTDFVSGYKWPLMYYKAIRVYPFLTKKRNIDYKLPWELSRCQHLPILGLAYHITKNNRFAEEFVYQIKDWINKNPYKKGINWWVAMEVAIRAVNWIWAYQFLKELTTLTKRFKDEFFNSLYLHGRYIYENLEEDSRGNHLISDLIGLIYLGLFFDIDESKEWKEFGYGRIYKEIRYQFKEGVHHEQCTNYHFLVAEFVTSAILLARANNLEVPEDILLQCEKMIEFVMYYTRPDGTAPIIGDADDGRLYKLFCDNINDHRYLLNLGAVLFNRKDFKGAYPEFHPMSYLLLGEDVLDKFNDIPVKKKEIISNAYPETGFFISRHKDIYFLIKSGIEEKPEMTAHLHNDIFSFTLSIGDENIIIDPGSYVYARDPKVRNIFRGTAYHNTVMIDGIEQNRFYKSLKIHPRFFDLKNYDTLTKIIKWETNSEYDWFEAEHYGYQKLKDPVIHKRKIFFDKKRKQVEITDAFNCKKKHQFEWFFHFAPNITLEDDGIDPLIVRTIGSSGPNIELVPKNPSIGIKCEIINNWVSNRYGVKEKSLSVIYTLSVYGNIKISFLIKRCT